MLPPPISLTDVNSYNNENAKSREAINLTIHSEKMDEESYHPEYRMKVSVLGQNSKWPISWTQNWREGRRQGRLHLGNCMYLACNNDELLPETKPSFNILFMMPDGWNHGPPQFSKTTQRWNTVDFSRLQRLLPEILCIYKLSERYHTGNGSSRDEQPKCCMGAPRTLRYLDDSLNTDPLWKTHEYMGKKCRRWEGVVICTGGWGVFCLHTILPCCVSPLEFYFSSPLPPAFKSQQKSLTCKESFLIFLNVSISHLRLSPLILYISFAYDNVYAVCSLTQQLLEGSFFLFFSIVPNSAGHEAVTHHLFPGTKSHQSRLGQWVKFLLTESNNHHNAQFLLLLLDWQVNFIYSI